MAKDALKVTGRHEKNIPRITGGHHYQEATPWRGKRKIRDKIKALELKKSL